MTTIGAEVAAGFEPVREAFEANFARHGDIGAAVCVYQDGRPVVDLWGGAADPATGRPWTRDTLQLVYSATKGATATMAHMLAERGALDLDAPVAKYWSEFAANGKADIPVRWLLSTEPAWSRWTDRFSRWPESPWAPSPRRVPAATSPQSQRPMGLDSSPQPPMPVTRLFRSLGWDKVPNPRFDGGAP